MNSFVVWDVMLSSPLKVKQCFGGICLALLPTCFILVSCFAYSSTLKMEMMWPSETLVDFLQTTWHYCPEDRTLLNNKLFLYIKEILPLFTPEPFDGT
jgi:hypothetical protein